MTEAPETPQVDEPAPSEEPAEVPGEEAEEESGAPEEGGDGGEQSSEGF